MADHPPGSAAGRRASSTCIRSRIRIMTSASCNRSARASRLGGGSRQTCTSWPDSRAKAGRGPGGIGIIVQYRYLHCGHPYRRKCIPPAFVHFRSMVRNGKGRDHAGRMARASLGSVVSHDRSGHGCLPGLAVEADWRGTGMIRNARADAVCPRGRCRIVPSRASEESGTVAVQILRRFSVRFAAWFRGAPIGTMPVPLSWASVAARAAANLRWQPRSGMI